MAIEWFVSADGHIAETWDIYPERIEKRFRDRAPRMESTRDDGDLYVLDGVPIQDPGFAGAQMNEKVEHGHVIRGKGYRFADVRPGGYDPVAREKDQDLDHIRAEVIYPLLAFRFWTSQDAEYRRACVRVYNDWLAEFCASNPKRHIGAGLLPLAGPIEWSIAEAEHAAKLGLGTLMIPARSTDRPYVSPEYTPLWEALQDLGLPVAFHSGSYTEFPSTKGKLFPTLGLEMKIQVMMEGMTEIICGAIPQKFPKLKFVLVEGGIGWIPSVLRLLDHVWEDHHAWMEPKLDETPSFYFKRQFWATFEDDLPGVRLRDLIGVDRIMWGSDYPHTEGTFPHSREQIAKDFAGVPENETRMAVVENAAKLYRIDLA